MLAQITGTVFGWKHMHERLLLLVGRSSSGIDSLILAYTIIKTLKNHFCLSTHIICLLRSEEERLVISAGATILDYLHM